MGALYQTAVGMSRLGRNYFEIFGAVRGGLLSERSEDPSRPIKSEGRCAAL
jgi:hypothetical protein